MSLTTTVLETALEEDPDEHQGCDKHGPVGWDLESSRKGYWSRAVVTDARG